MNLFKPFRNNSRKIFHGWYIVAASSWINAIGGSLHWKGFTVFFIPIANSLNLTYTQAALPFALARAENGLLGPMTGWLIDRFGVRPMMLIGTLLAGLGYILLSRTETFSSFLIIYIFAITLGGSTSFMQASTTAINMWFVKKRGIAVSINSAAFRLGGAFMVPLLSVVVLKWGWEVASIWVGVGMLLFIAPAALIFKRSPESIGENPDGISTKKNDPKKLNSEISNNDWETKDALKSSVFWILALGTVLRMAVHGTIYVHFIPILVWKGETQQVAANMIGGIALISVPIIIIFGFISDILPRQKLMSALYLSPALSLLLINYVNGTWPIFLAMILFIGTEVGSGLNWALVGDMFGRKNFATIRGWISPMYNISLIIGPLLAGYSKDKTGSYEYVLLTGSLFMLIAAITFFILKTPKRN